MAIELDGSDALSPYDELDVESQSSNRTPIELFESQLSERRFHNVPVVNMIILGVSALLLCKLSTKYHQLYATSSIVATVATNIVLFSIADAMAQTIAAYFAYYTPGKVVRVPHVTRRDQYSDASSGIDAYLLFVDYGEELQHEDGILTSDNSEILFSTRFVIRRYVAFVFWGFLMAFCQVAWYKFLNSNFTEDPTLVVVIQKVLTDQLCYSPVSLACFFTYGTIVIESGTWEDAKAKLYKIYVSTLACNFCLWCPVQFINFLIMPKSLQVPFSSTIGVLWNCFLSFRNAQASQ